MSQMMIESGAEYPAADANRRSEGPGYLVVVEASENGWGAYVPDLPGVVAAGESEQEVRELILEAVAFHVEGLRADGEPVPGPLSKVLWATAP